MNNTARLAEIDRLLSNIPRFECKPGCGDCCGPVAMSKLELKRLVQASGLPDKRLSTAFMLKTGCLDCPLLDQATHRCTQYEIRPAICKIFGSSLHARLRCPHGLGPPNPLTAEATNKLVDQVMQLGFGYSEPLEEACESLFAAFGAPERALGSASAHNGPVTITIDL